MLIAIAIPVVLAFSHVAGAPLFIDAVAKPKIQVERLETILGVVAKRGVECPRFKLDDGRMISLMGVGSAIQVGVPLKLTGRWVQQSICQQGRTFSVSKIEYFKK
jgi:hypothetical protein